MKPDQNDAEGQMQADMHYYVTYLASVAAGFNLSDARDIALAAHFVDCSGDPGPLEAPWIGHKELEHTIGPVRMMYQAALSVLDSTRARDIWAAFHFLPAMREDPGYRMHYAWDNQHRDPPEDPDKLQSEGFLESFTITESSSSGSQNENSWLEFKANENGGGKKKDTNPLQKLFFRFQGKKDKDKEVKGGREGKQEQEEDYADPQTVGKGRRTDELFGSSATPRPLATGWKWRCFPHSDTSFAMSTDTLDKFADTKWSPEQVLALVGVRLHVMADTFSHAGCAAPIGKWNCFTDLAIRWPHQSKKDQIDEDRFVKLNFSGGSHAPSDILAMGHATYGALPDFPGIIWRATTKGGQQIFRHNPVTYKHCTWMLVTWLQQFRMALDKKLPPEEKLHQRIDVTTQLAASELLRKLDFEAEPFQYPMKGELLKEGSFFDPLISYGFNGQKESDRYLKARCSHLYKHVAGLIATELKRRQQYSEEKLRRALPKIHNFYNNEDESDFQRREKALGLGARVSSTLSLDQPAFTDVDLDTEYLIVRRVRVEYFAETERDNDWSRLRCVNNAVAYHKSWFEKEVRTKLEA